MAKLYNILLSILLAFNMSRCTPPADIETEQPQQVITDTGRESASDTNTQSPGKPREDMEVEVAP